MADADRLTLTLSTGGDVVIKLRPDLAPGHVAADHRAREQRLLRRSRVPPRDPGLHGPGRRSDRHRHAAARDLPNLKAEFSSAPHVRGAASMARTPSPDSANSQFFICFDDAGFLDGQYTVWGEVESGMEHVDALPDGEPPREPGKIVKATVGKAGE